MKQTKKKLGVQLAKYLKTHERSNTTPRPFLYQGHYGRQEAFQHAQQTPSQQAEQVSERVKFAKRVTSKNENDKTS